MEKTLQKVELHSSFQSRGRQGHLLELQEGCLGVDPHGSTL